jgi:hypothetical protein
MAEPIDRWREMLATERAFARIAAGEARLAMGRGVTVVELIEHAALCGRTDALEVLLETEPGGPTRAAPTGCFDLIAAYETARLAVPEPARERLRAHTLDRLLGQLRDNPELIDCRAYDGKTLLHFAAGAHDDELVGLLLSLGAAAGVTDAHARSPIFSAANRHVLPRSRTPRDGYGAVEKLIGAGADPDLPGGEGRQTPLHVAARRGNVGVAAALLDGGARIDPADACGVVPLQRAINCRQHAVAALLRARGAH